MAQGSQDHSLTEWAVLALLAESPSHGFAIARRLAPDGDVGKVLTVRRPLVYRALDRLVESGLATSVRVEPGEAGPRRTVHTITRRGQRRLDQWLGSPVSHVRDLRVEFLLKLLALRRSGRSPSALIERQRAALDETLSALEETGGEAPDDVDLWRRHNARAVRAFLAELSHPTAGG